MNWLADHWFRLLLVALYLSMLAYHCRLGTRQTRSLSDYLVAGRSLGGWVIALSFYATFVSTNSFIGQAGKSWEVGLIWWIKVGVYGPLCWLAWLVVAPRFYRQSRQFASLTLSDFLGTRYGSTALRRLTAVVILAACSLYLVAIYKGSSHALEQFLGFSYGWATLVIFVIVTTYTLLGGFRSVVLTDSVQGVLMAVGAVAIMVAVVNRGGGPTLILERLEAVDPRLVSWEGKLPLGAILGLGLAGGLKLLVDPRQVSRLYGLKDERALRTARIVAPLLITLTYFCLLPLGAFAHSIIPTNAISDSDMVTPYLLGRAEIMGPVASSFFLLVLLAAAMSSLDSVLLVAASAVTRDLLILDEEDPTAINKTRVWVVLVSLASMLLALNPFADIVEITAFSGSLFAACFMPTLVLGLYWQRGTAAASVACVVVGSSTVIGWFLVKHSTGWIAWHEVYVGLAASTAVYVGVSFFTNNRRAQACQAGPARR